MKPRHRRHCTARPHLFDELGPITDETTAVIAQLLSDLHLQFEQRFLGEIMRHHDAIRTSPKNSNPLCLTGLSQSDEPFRAAPAQRSPRQTPIMLADQPSPILINGPSTNVTALNWLGERFVRKTTAPSHLRPVPAGAAPIVPRRHRAARPMYQRETYRKCGMQTRVRTGHTGSRHCGLRVLK